MTTDTVPQTVLFPDLFDKPLFAKFNQEQASSDGGAVLLKAAERVYGLVKAFARCLSDKRSPEKIRHTLADLIGQRIFGIACGHPDCNDAEHLADDPIHKLLLGRDPVAGESLASQPTLSRFENAERRRPQHEGRRLGAPDELVWNHLKTHGVRKRLLQTPQELKRYVLGHMRSLQRTPALLRGFFKKPSLRYINRVIGCLTSDR